MVFSVIYSKPYLSSVVMFMVLPARISDGVLRFSIFSSKTRELKWTDMFVTGVMESSTVRFAKK